MTPTLQPATAMAPILALSISLKNMCHQFLRISYWSNSEYWSQKCTLNGNIHSTKLDVYAVKQSAQISYLFYPKTSKVGKMYLGYPGNQKGS